MASMYNPAFDVTPPKYIAAIIPRQGAFIFLLKEIWLH